MLEQQTEEDAPVVATTTAAALAPAARAASRREAALALFRLRLLQNARLRQHSAYLARCREDGREISATYLITARADIDHLILIEQALTRFSPPS